MTEITMNAISEENVSGRLDISGWVKAHKRVLYSIVTPFSATDTVPFLTFLRFFAAPLDATHIPRRQ